MKARLKKKYAKAKEYIESFATRPVPNYSLKSMMQIYYFAEKFDRKGQVVRYVR